MLYQCCTKNNHFKKARPPHLFAVLPAAALRKDEAHQEGPGVTFVQQCCRPYPKMVIPR